MTSTLTFRGRLPGVATDPTLPPVEQPVRLDVAGFVGLAERGPLDLPVAVEDELAYAAVFGGDLLVAQEEGVPVRAQLPDAVRAFFANGGRRCHVVRVAGPGARPARWAVPGLRVRQPDGTEAPVLVESAWPGAWSAGTTVRADLLGQFLPVAGDYRRPAADAPGTVDLAPGATVGVRPGDVLRLGTSPGIDVFVRVAGVDHADARLSIDREVVDGPDPLPDLVALETVRLLRLTLVVGQHRPDGARQLERLSDLGLDSWSDALQPIDDHRPDPTRSATLRQHADTVTALGTGLLVPVTEPGGALPVAGEQEGEDDLDTFDPRWLVDDRLTDDTVLSLTGHADQLTVLAKDPVQLRGAHALLGIDEVALVAAPDVTQRGWSPVVPTPVPVTPVEPEPVPPVDWSDFRCCSDEIVVPPPVPPVDPTPPSVSDLPELDRTADYDELALVEVQAALVTLCAARADAVALLSVPRHYDVASTLAWSGRLTALGRLGDSTGSGSSPLSYAASFHPWVSTSAGLPVTTSSPPVLRDAPPDGAVAGMIAARELARGSWVAPAGVPLRGVVRLATPAPLSDADRVQLFDAHANLVEQHPGVFTTISAHTLSADPQLLQVSVRRLLILLRKICLRLGERYVFEINNDRFRQLVRMRFDRTLTTLAERGALHAFRVSTADGLNTAADQDAGRFVVSLQIAPTSPVEFITVTLLRTGEGLLDVVEG
ncbi:hypothetical protein ASC77_09475 [Nocardioides sp. Root1257]|uniref:phage tail sheath C-terminal domain-containing protein n=1 Tax=unclassified Nocardioides TaxID=2615069 RepID=UPI0006F40246|nr:MULTISPECIES: phage tail sheath C-terminal domain-containing protein [unclassified Nocardioides]KQW48937.1 hypothetical protein ASC77_09475 [Nocardioides sp. Root1257]KRC48112.1 hypothetical protein ASE24_09480 [Nocardioides sp. Root224]